MDEWGESMSILALITGGARSGKSSFAGRLASLWSDDVVFIATCQPLDEEMRRRVELHRRQRPAGWTTVEEEFDLPRVLRQVGRTEGRVVILDCLTLWLSNLFSVHQQADPAGCEAEVLERVGEFIAAAEEVRGRGVRLIVVTNEVGSGIVPVNALARSFRDALGRANQMVAATADQVYLLVSGLPLQVKPGEAADLLLGDREAGERESAHE